MSSKEAIATAKLAMDNCNSGLDQIKAMIRSNQSLVDDFNSRHSAWESKRDTANALWNTKNTARQNDQSNWDNDYNNILRSKQQEVHNAGCGGCGTNPGCASGWHESGHHGCGFWNGQCERECMQNDDTARNNARTQKGNNRPSNYNEPQFSDTEPTMPAENTTNVSIHCCSDVQNIIGSQITNSDLTQQNDCASKLKKDYDNLNNAPPSAPPPPAPPSPLLAPPSGLPLKIPSNSTSLLDKLKANKMSVISIILVIVTCFSLSGVLAITIDMD